MSEIGCKNGIISKLKNKKLTTLNEEMESIKTQLLDMSAKPKGVTKQIQKTSQIGHLSTHSL
jgi:hypothetical protein